MIGDRAPQVVDVKAAIGNLHDSEMLELREAEVCEEAFEVVSRDSLIARTLGNIGENEEPDRVQVWKKC
jgi:hypothetical protein